MTIPKDKLMHFAVGAAMAVFALLLWQLAMQLAPLAAHPLATALSLAGFMAGAQKEGTDRLDNLLMYHRGEAPIHGVEWLDWLATWAGATLVAVALVKAGLA